MGNQNDMDELLALRAERDAALAELEAIKEVASRAEYWKQRAKSAEGHLFANDVRAAARALHANTTQNEIPFDELSEADRHRRYRGAWTVIASINAERARRLPHDSRDEYVWCGCGDGYPVNSYGAGFMAANSGVCENCAAMSQEASHD
ncbi:hypothetical protein ACNFCJ_20945 [Pseudomonas sp. NY15364]|uniref:hypothetical protein n=1 Tax=Pseudomonas sp. NY15364 TaxID=3400353 RepID=UPI003A89F69B